MVFVGDLSIVHGCSWALSTNVHITFGAAPWCTVPTRPGPGLPSGSGAVRRADGGADGHAEPPRDALAHRPGRRVPRRGVDWQPLPWRDDDGAR